MPVNNFSRPAAPAATTVVRILRSWQPWWGPTPERPMRARQRPCSVSGVSLGLTGHLPGGPLRCPARRPRPRRPICRSGRRGRCRGDLDGRRRNADFWCGDRRRALSVPVLTVADARAVTGTAAARVYGTSGPGEPAGHGCARTLCCHGNQRQDHHNLLPELPAAGAGKHHRAHRHH